ncbi:hypothetical protein COU13_01795 [Candidatus Kaiserbacteria bacterium CG10_big_fil_rev_8_21_14_0_10_43_70]|uniref:Fibronectin type-III domain-containing protein n=1 Tax=Candidatus Kaiserbacteria bacterium CG10_big_fil_rev_8_21_14_0_10_43_70 TaxID=1974605 RepID=A0A2H0UIR7_9BACT|nr:MAG: hypothetical protein COU13_01795 [Candidatus Kaiserbacteria bacterium CG10_big_fil_rev_8_21_14_0_10_43_70]
MSKTTGTIAVVLALLILAVAIFYSGAVDGFFSKFSANFANATSTPNGSVDGTDNAATESAPEAITGSAATPTDTTVAVVGTVTPNGAFTQYWYEYGTTIQLGSKTTSYEIGSGYFAIPSPAYIAGLTKETTYFFRLVAQNKFGTVAGSQHSFQTTDATPAPVGSTPAIKTKEASGLTSITATVNGEVNSNNATTLYWFEYGKSRDLGNVTTLTPAGTGDVTGSVSHTLIDLEANTTYYYRLNSQNQFGTVNGATLTFKTSTL